MALAVDLPFCRLTRARRKTSNHPSEWQALHACQVRTFRRATAPSGTPHPRTAQEKLQNFPHSNHPSEWQASTPVVRARTGAQQRRHALHIQTRPLLQLFLHALLIAALVLGTALPAAAQNTLRLATTTSLENSGLLDHLLPPFQQHCACQVQVIPVGTGRALQLGKRGDVDALLVHAPDAEKAFMAQGYGESRAPIAYNYFILLSPPNDPADVASATDILDALAKIAKTRAKFLSRGDDSGTHKKEVDLWRRLRQSTPAMANLKLQRDWYIEAGTGMGQAILMADELGAYLISDSGTYLHLQDRARLRPVPPLAKSTLLYNPYSIIVISQTRHPHANASLARQFADWLQTPAARRRIANYRLLGEPLFTPHGE